MSCLLLTKIWSFQYRKRRSGSYEVTPWLMNCSAPPMEQMRRKLKEIPPIHLFMLFQLDRISSTSRGQMMFKLICPGSLLWIATRLSSPQHRIQREKIILLNIEVVRLCFSLLHHRSLCIWLLMAITWTTPRAIKRRSSSEFNNLFGLPRLLLKARHLFYEMENNAFILFLVVSRLYKRRNVLFL